MADEMKRGLWLPSLDTQKMRSLYAHDLSGRALVRRVDAKAVARGVHRSTAELEADIGGLHPKPQRKPIPIQVGQIRRPDSRISQAILLKDNEPNFRFR
jgi:hypothetical protein